MSTYNKTNNPFAPNAREKTVMVEMVRSPGGRNYEVSRVWKQNEINQYTTTEEKINKREWTREFVRADLTVT